MKKRETSLKGSQPITNFFLPSPEKEEVMDGVSEKDSRKDIESDCDDLPEAGFLSSVLSSRENKVTTDEDGSVPKFKISLDSILKEREEKAKTNAKLEQLQDELKDMEIGDSTILEDHSLSLSKYVTSNTIEAIHPALEIFDSKRVFQLYLNANLQIPDGETGKFQMLLKDCAPMDYSNLITLGIFRQYSRQIVTTPWLLTWLFHFMAVTSNPTIMYCCFQTLNSAILHSKTNKSCCLSWRPSVADITAVLYNYGADLNKLSLDKSSFDISIEQLENMKLGNKLKNNDIQIADEGILEGLLRCNLIQVIKTLFLFLDCDSSQYSNEEAAGLLKMLCIISLDRNFCHSLLKTEMESTISKLLLRITDTFWDTQAIPLAELLIKVADHHHNLVYLAKLMPPSFRGIQFQKILCIVSIMKLTNTEISVDIHDLKPSIVLDLLKQRPLYKISDLYLLNSIVYLLDVFIGIDPNACSRKTIQEIVTLLKQAAGKIKENFNCIDTTKVKDLMIRVASKLTIQTQFMPTNNKTLFDYIQVQNVTEPLRNSEEDKI